MPFYLPSDSNWLKPCYFFLSVPLSNILITLDTLSILMEENDLRWEDFILFVLSDIEIFDTGAYKSGGE